MKEVKIPFNAWSKERLEKGLKLATTRKKRYGKIGDTFSVDIGKGTYIFQLIAIFPLTLYYVAKDLYNIEGAESPLEFRKVWEEIHSKLGWTPNKVAFVHLFKLERVNLPKKDYGWADS